MTKDELAVWAVCTVLAIAAFIVAWKWKEEDDTDDDQTW